jgi:NADPH2:quinone reductase
MNPVDAYIRQGGESHAAPALPAVLHGDVAGIVEEVGEGVTDFKPGDEVYGCPGGFKGTGGALAEYMLADQRLIAHKPKNITMKEAAVLPLVTLTAWEALFDQGNIKKGQDVLIHGATGGVGHVAIQLAKWAGANVYTTASTEKKLSIATQLGADIGINYKQNTVEEYVKKYTNGKGFDLVFDTVGGDNLDLSFEAAAINGTVVSILTYSKHDLSKMHMKGLSLHVTYMLLKIVNEDQRYRHGEMLKEITKIVEAEQLKPLIDTNVFTFNQVEEAHKYLESNKSIGKVLIKNDW